MGKGFQQKPNDSGARRHARIWKGLLHPVTIISLLATLLIGYFNHELTQQKELTERQLTLKQQEMDQKQKELQGLKDEFTAYKEKVGKPVTDGVVVKGPTSFQVTALKSEPLRSQDLTITVNDLKKKEATGKLAVWATVQYKNLPEVQIRAAEVGYVLKYPEENGYRIEVVHVDESSARFSIART